MAAGRGTVATGSVGRRGAAGPRPLLPAFPLLWGVGAPAVSHITGVSSTRYGVSSTHYGRLLWWG